MFLDTNDDWKDALRAPSIRTRILQECLAEKERILHMWFAGIDWADNHHDVVVIDAAAHKVAQLRIAHTPKG
ncbi:hypothetical protein KSD_01910 [Ktedonobacter sp. SOSP1-85]|nr:hypothetical protein KSD_01910 [Ktedonobacter sp. SOSP1-85]